MLCAHKNGFGKIFFLFVIVPEARQNNQNKMSLKDVRTKNISPVSNSILLNNKARIHLIWKTYFEKRSPNLIIIADSDSHLSAGIYHANKMRFDTLTLTFSSK